MKREYRESRGETVSKVNLISRAPLHAGNRGAREGRGREREGTHFDVKRGAPGPLSRSTRRYCYYEPGSLLIIKKEPEVAACDTTEVLQTLRSVGVGSSGCQSIGMTLPRDSVAS